MSETVIDVQGLGKQYHIGALNQQKITLRQSVTRAVTAPVRRAFNVLRGQASAASDLQETIWALKDISFQVKRGEVLGVIGHNGSGKSTLLKLLTRITQPTTGQIDITGRVGALLEVGTGFHPELTGRENIYLNGSILGMRRAETTHHFDEIVEFAGVEQFIDTPVKHYSSGMYTRLAFAVAAHLNPEILLVDEVLSVGDAAFQKRSIGKMDEVSQQGRTVLFVSHNMAAVRSLCPRSLLLEKGEIACLDSTAQCLDRYLTTQGGMPKQIDLTDHSRQNLRGYSGRIQMTGIGIDVSGDTATFYTDEAPNIELTFDIHETVQDVTLGMAVFTRDDVRVFDLVSHDSFAPIDELKPGTYTARCTLPRDLLLPGQYYIEPGVRSGSSIDIDYIPRGLEIQVESREKIDSLWLTNRWGIVKVHSDWTLDRT